MWAAWLEWWAAWLVRLVAPRPEGLLRNCLGAICLLALVSFGIALRMMAVGYKLRA